MPQGLEMVSGLRPFLVFFCLGQGLLLWWTAGQYDPAPGEANEPPPKAARPMAKFPSSTGFSATATVDTAAASYPIENGSK